MATLGPNISFSSIGPSGAPDIAYSNAYMVGQTPWGVDGQWTVSSSFADFLRQYGGLNKLTAVASGLTADTYTVESTDAVIQCYYNVKAYFDEKGPNSPGVLFFNRVCATSSGPTAASKTFADQAGSNNTTVAAKWKGLHGGTVQAYVINPSPRKGVLTLQAGTVSVTSGSTSVTGVGTSFVTGSTWVGWGIKIGTDYYTITSVASTTALTLSDNASNTWSGATFSVGNNTTAAYLNLYHPQSGIREEWDIGTAADAADVSRKSQLVTVTLPAGGQLPKTTVPGAVGATKLNSGSAATADSYAATDADYVGTTTAANVKTGLQVFNSFDIGTGLICIPGKTSATIDSGLKTASENYYRVALYGPSAGLTLTTAQTEFANVSSNFGAGWVPRILVPDQNSTSNGLLTVDNVGSLAGLCARMDRNYGGPHKSPAGSSHPFNGVVDIERQSAGGPEIYDDAASNNLADSNVNTIRVKGGIVSWGLRTFASDERYRQINVSRTVCLVYYSCFQLMQKRTFEPIDSFGKLFSAIKGDLDSFFFTLWSQGSVYGTQPGNSARKTDAWFVVCDVGNNPNVMLGKGEVHADVSFVPTPNAEKITVPIQVAAPGFGAAAAGVF